MSFPLQFCIRGFKMSLTKVNLHSRLYKCTKLSAVALSQTAITKPSANSTDLDRAELVLLKNLLTSNKQDIKLLESKNNCPNYSLMKTTHVNHQTNQNNYKQHLIVWENILLSPRRVQKKCKVLKSNRKETPDSFMTIKPEMWYCSAVQTNDSYPNKNVEIKDWSLEFDAKSTVYMDVQNNKFEEKRKTSSGPSPEQLSLVLLRLREELPYFFEGRHRYSIYSKDLLFVNKLTRTTTRSLKAYKFIITTFQYAGQFFWSKTSFEVVRITKHSEDNTIKLRWTAKGIPWYQLPFFVLTGKPQSSLFYRYVDGFSIFEVGRDGLVHCHRLDKVIPTSSPERQKWSLRMQILTLLGLTDIENRRVCDAFQVKNQEMLKKV